MADNFSPEIIKKNEGKMREYYEVMFSLQAESREELKNKAIAKFLEEKGGYWKDGVKYVTCYKYYVEEITDGRRIYLVRPAYLNKGMDFTVWAEKVKDGKDSRPSHKDIKNDLQIKSKENRTQLSLLMAAIDRVWSCEEPDNVLRDIRLDFNQGFPPELLLKILKWLFIEQDVTYWNYVGRQMLKDGIDEEFNQSSGRREEKKKRGIVPPAKA